MDLKSKLFIAYTKYIPFLIAICQILDLVLELCGINLMFGWMCHISVLALLFILLASYVLKFCFYHRIFLYFSIILQIVTWVDYLIQFPITKDLFIILLLSSFFIVCIIALINYLKHNEQIKIIKRRPTNSNR